MSKKGAVTRALFVFERRGEGGLNPSPLGKESNSRKGKLAGIKYNSPDARESLA